MIFQLFTVFVIPIVISLIITPWIIQLARRVGAIDQPNARKIHSYPVPRLGGVAIYMSFFLSLGILRLIDPGFHKMVLLGQPRGVMLIAGLVLILGLGIFDDLRPRTPIEKLLVQLVAATLVYVAGFRITSTTVPLAKGVFNLGVLQYPVTLLWIVGITNAFNLIDGLDGLAGGVAVITGFTISAISLLGGDISTTTMAVLLAGAVVGFLRYNFNPAKIFLGDSGSLFVGFALAVFSMRSSTKGSAALAILVPILCLGLPIMETLLSMLRRLLGSLLPDKAKSTSFISKVASMFSPDIGHIHHQLIALGISHRKVVLLLYVVSCAFGVGAFVATITTNIGVSLIIIAVAVATVVGVRQLRYREMAVLRNGVLLPIYDWPLMNRRVFQGFLDLAFILVAYVTAFYVVNRGALPIAAEQTLFLTLPFVCGIKLLVLYLSGQYRGTFRHLGIGDVLRTLKAVIFAELITGAVLCFLPEPWRVRDLPLLLLDFYLFLSLVAGIRISFQVLNYLFHRDYNGGKRVLIYGADAHGALVLQQILHDDTLNLSPVGFLDDSPQLEGHRFHGFPVYGGHWILRQLIKKIKVEEILLSGDGLRPIILERLKGLARTHGLAIRRFGIHLQEVSFEPQSSKSVPRTVVANRETIQQNSDQFVPRNTKPR
jgi:UDP-GlcNAc:undecaprenyl-phosphate GlcNAc-1-phosphate transferase